MSGTIEPITALDRAFTDLAKAVANLDSEQLTRPTNCPAWDVRGLLNHILGGALMYIRVNEGEIAGEDAGDVAGDNPTAAVARTADANVASWRAAGALDGERAYPWGTFPATAGLLINLGEVALHTWDLARATGQAAAIDNDVAQLVFDFYRQVPMDDMRANGVYGPEIPVAASASAQDRLLGFLSRQP